MSESTLPRWLYVVLLAVFGLAALWVWQQRQAMADPALNPVDAARRLLGVAEVVGGLLLTLCAFFALGLFREGWQAWQSAKRPRASAIWLLGLALVVAGWQMRALLLERVAQRLEPALEIQPSDRETFQPR